MMKHVLVILLSMLLFTWGCSNNTTNQENAEGKETTESATQVEKEKKVATDQVKQKAAEAVKKEAQTADEPAGERQDAVATNYYDLPEEQADQLREQLGTQSLSQLDDGPLNVMKNYLARTVIGGQSPYGNRLYSNYFHFIYNSLPNFVSKMERHNGYNKGQGEENPRDQLMAYSIYRLDRSAENLKRLYDWGRPMLKTLVPEAVYHKRFARAVNGRVEGYETLQQFKDFDIKLQEAYDEYFNEKGELKDPELACGAYGFDMYTLQQKIAGHLNVDVHYGSIPPHISFWMRRVHEGNAETVYEILKDIQAAYQ